MGLKWSIKKIGNKYRVHRNDKRKSEIQGMSFFEPRGIMDVLDNHPKNILVYGQTKLTSMQHKSTGETMDQPAALRNRGRGKELEMRKDKVANAITSVQTDSIVVQNSMKEISPKLKQKTSQTKSISYQREQRTKS